MLLAATLAGRQPWWCFCLRIRAASTHLARQQSLGPRSSTAAARQGSREPARRHARHAGLHYTGLVVAKKAWPGVQDRAGWQVESAAGRQPSAAGSKRGRAGSAGSPCCPAASRALCLFSQQEEPVTCFFQGCLTGRPLQQLRCLYMYLCRPCASWNPLINLQQAPTLITVCPGAPDAKDSIVQRNWAAVPAAATVATNLPRQQACAAPPRKDRQRMHAHQAACRQAGGQSLLGA